MFDFENGSIFKLSKNEEAGKGDVQELLVEGEFVVESFKSVRDYVVFTNKRIIAVNVQGMTGLKKDFTSLPYSKVQAFSVETAGFVSLEGPADSELDLLFSTLGMIRFEFARGIDIKEICKAISTYVL